MIRKLYRSIRNFNLATQKPEDYPRMVLANITAFLGSLITMFYGLFFGLVIKHWPSGLIIISISLTYFLYYPIFIKRGFASAVKFYLILFLFHISFITILLTSASLGFHLYLFLASPVSYLVIKKEKNPYFPITISICSLVLMVTAQFLGDRFVIFSFSEKMDQFLLISCLFFIFLVLLLITYFYRLELARREDDTRTYMKKLRLEIRNRENKEKQLLQYRRKLNLAMTTSGVSFWEWNRENQLFHFDEICLSFMGYCVNDGPFDSSWWVSRLHPDEIKSIMTYYRDFYRKRENTFNLEYRFKRKDGQWIWINCVGYVQEKDSDDKATTLLGIHRETTAEKELGIQRENLIQELNEALENIKTLNGMLPICSSCKKIRDDRGYWKQIESYIQQHSKAVFSHSLCPECLEEYYPDEYREIINKEKNNT